MTHDTSVLVNYERTPQTHDLQYQLRNRKVSKKQHIDNCATATNHSGLSETRFISAGD